MVWCKISAKDEFKKKKKKKKSGKSESLYPHFET